MTVSLYIECWHEAAKHKWIESQKHGTDLGDEALHDWFSRHWPIYCRIGRLEHLAGMRAWAEFPMDDFNLITHLQAQGDNETIDWILERAWQGLENLNLINDAQEWALPIDRVIEILGALHLNLAQLDPPMSRPAPQRFATPRTLQSGD